VVQAAERDPVPDESSSGCTSDTDVAEEVSVPTEAPMGSLEAAEDPATPVVSPSPTEDEAFLAVTGFTLDSGDGVNDSSSDAGPALVPDAAAIIDAGAVGT
jgi:hypothetical protein